MSEKSSAVTIPTLQQIAREAAVDVYYSGTLCGLERVQGMADAVAVAVVQQFARYRPQHDEDCQITTCATCGCTSDHICHVTGTPFDDPTDHAYVTQDCSCGLSALLVSVVSAQEEEQEHDHARLAPPERVSESDQRGDVKPSSIQGEN